MLDTKEPAPRPPEKCNPADVLPALRDAIRNGEVSLEGSRSHQAKQRASQDIALFRERYASSALLEEPPDELASHIVDRFSVQWEILVAMTQRCQAALPEAPAELPDISSEEVQDSIREEVMWQLFTDYCEIVAELSAEARDRGDKHIPRRLLELKIPLYHSPDDIRKLKADYPTVPEYKLVDCIRLNARNPRVPLAEYVESRKLDVEPVPFETAERYMQDVRRYCVSRGAATVSNNPNSKQHATAAFEAAKGYATRQDLDIGSEETAGFLHYARLLGVVTHGINHDFPSFEAFGDLGRERQSKVLEKLHSDYIAICDLLVNTRQERRREAYDSNPVLYRTPGDIARVMRVNADLERSDLLKLIFDHMSDMEEFIAESRSRASHYHHQHPEVSYSQLFRTIIHSPRDHEAAVERFLWEQSARLEKSRERAIQHPEASLAAARNILRTRTYDELKLTHDQKIAIQHLGNQAVEWLKYNLYHVSSQPLEEHHREKVMYEFRQVTALIHAGTMVKSVNVAPLDRLPLETRTVIWATILRQAVSIHKLAEQHLEGHEFHVPRFCAFFSSTTMWKLIDRYGGELEPGEIIQAALRNPRTPHETIKSLAADESTPPKLKK